MDCLNLKKLMEESKKAGGIQKWIDHVTASLQTGLAVEEVFTLTKLEIQVPFQKLGFPTFESFLERVPNLVALLKDPNSIYQTRSVSPIGPSDHELKIGSRVVWFAPDSTPQKGSLRWLGRVEKIMCAGVDCDEKISSADALYWRGEKLFHGIPGHGRVFRLHELMLKSDYEKRPGSKLTKAISKAMTKMRIRDSPSSGSEGNSTFHAPSPDGASYDVIYPYSVDCSPEGLKVNSLVVWPSDGGVCHTGIVQWLGYIDCNSGLVAGVDFQRNIGKTSGNLGPHKLFECLPNQGMFMSVNGLIKYEDFYQNQSSTPSPNDSVKSLEGPSVIQLPVMSNIEEEIRNQIIPLDLSRLSNIDVTDSGPEKEPIVGNLLGIDLGDPISSPKPQSPEPYYSRGTTESDVNANINISEARTPEAVTKFRHANSSEARSPPEDLTNFRLLPRQNSEPPELIDTYIEPCITLSRLDRLNGIPRGIQGRNNSCYIDSPLFALFACTDVFDEAMLEDDIYESVPVRRLKQILRIQIVNSIRRNFFCSADRVDKLRVPLGEYDRKFLSSMGDCQEFLQTLLAKFLRLRQFIKYTSGVTDYMHQLLLHPKFTTEFGTVQHLLEGSMLSQGLKFEKIPEPGLLLILPWAKGRLVTHSHVIPNLTLDITHMLSEAPRPCVLCNSALARMECTECFHAINATNGAKSIAFCVPCFDAFHRHNQRVHHAPFANLIDYPEYILSKYQASRTFQAVEIELRAVICHVNTNHFITFSKCGPGRLAPWVKHDSMFEGNSPKVNLVFGLAECLDELERDPASASKDWDLFTPEVKQVLSNTHLCIYAPVRQKDLTEILETTTV